MSLARDARLAPALEINGLAKRFGATRALDGAALTVRAGEVHALIGENGSGKSTLVKILAGYHRPDAGSIRIWGHAAALPIRPAAHPIAVVHQDLGLVGSISVLENILVSDRYAAPALAPIAWRRQRREVRARLDALGIAIDIDAPVATLSRAQQALVGIARALRQLERHGQRQALIILDEPTASLSSAEAAPVFATLRGIANAGGSVLYISHKLLEISEIADHVTVFRDGRDVGTKPRGGFDTEGLVALMLGAQPEHLATERAFPAQAAEALGVRGISGGSVRNVSFSLAEGHILGITGLVGMGQDDLPYLVSGAMPASAGSVAVGGQALARLGVRQSQARRMFLVPGDRRGQGVWVAGTAAENLGLPREAGRGVLAWRRPGTERTRALALMRDLQVRPLNPDLPLSAFSGGNQQKILLGKWLQMQPLVMLLHEPTQGVDIGAKREIHALIRQLAESGVAVCICSSDHEELAALCDRVLVLREGRFGAELAAAQVSLAAILAAINARPDAAMPGMH